MNFSGVGSFENDEALQWSKQFATRPNLYVAWDALIAITDLSINESVDLPLCVAGLAAAEVVAAVKGFPSAELPEPLRAWAKTQDAMDFGMMNWVLITLNAVQALKRIESNSALRNHHRKNRTLTMWKPILQDLAARLENKPKF